MTAHTEIGELLTSLTELKACPARRDAGGTGTGLFLKCCPSRAGSVKHPGQEIPGWNACRFRRSNAAVASKLKLLAPQLLIRIRKREPEVTGNPRGSATLHPAPLSKKSSKRPMRTARFTELRSLAEGLVRFCAQVGVEPARRETRQERLDGRQLAAGQIDEHQRARARRARRQRDQEHESHAWSTRQAMVKRTRRLRVTR